MNVKSFVLALVSLIAVAVPQTAGAEVVVNPNMPGVYLLAQEVFSASREMAQSPEPNPTLSTEHLDCYKNVLDREATVCTSRDARLRIVQPTGMNAVVFLLLFKDETGTVNVAELTIVGAAGDQHLATGESIRFFSPLEIEQFSTF